MGHNVKGFIVRMHKAEEVRAAISPELRFVSLKQGFALFPLPDEVLDMFGPGKSPFAELIYLTADLTNRLMGASSLSPILYFETDYFGGMGDQAAVLFESGRVVLGPKRSTGGGRPAVAPISEALGMMGMHTVGSDAFEAIGLAKHRHTEDWLE